MKARGNQKSNEANQIKSSPHDTENHQKIVQNQPKIDGNRGLDWPWGLLGEAWEPFGLPRPSGTEKRSQMTKKWPRLGFHFGVHFRHFPWFFDVFLHSFSSLHFDGYQDRFFMDFDHFFGSFLKAFFITNSPQMKSARSQMTKKWPRLGSHFKVHFRHFPLLFDVFLRSFSSLHFDGYQDRFFMDFDQFFGSFLGAFFISFRIVGK